MVDVYLNKGFNVNARDRLLQTPLHLACESHVWGIAEKLIAFKADLSAKDISGKTCAHFAACSVNPKIMSILIQN